MSEVIKGFPFLKDGILANCDYEKMYNESIENPEKFWDKQAQNLKWITPYKKIKNTSFTSPISIKWFEGGQINITENCIDRHLKEHGDDIAYIFESDDPNKDAEKITYKELSVKVNKLANALKNLGVKKGDRVTIYMPMILEATYSMLACARIGAVHSVVFGGFAPHAIKDRIIDCDSQFVITADEGVRGRKTIPLKSNIDKAIQGCNVKHVLVVKHTNKSIPWNDSVDVWYHDAIKEMSEVCKPEVMESEDPLFILYTSGSTGKPKGVLHTTAGYLLYTSMTHRYVFDYRPGDIFWCTADIGWITGHSYVVYGPLCNRATSVIFEGIPTCPTPSRHWEIIDKHNVNIYYTAPTAIRSLMVFGEEPLKNSTRKSLRVLGTVGEPINPEAWMWYYNHVGNKSCPIVDTWWQTETGGIMITPLAGCTIQKPGSATKPFFGIQPVIVDGNGKELEGACEGNLCIRDSWPSQMRTLYKDHERFEEAYFSSFKGYYFTGDGCRRDEDGYYWITGRVDDVLNVSGHRLGSAEIESSLVASESVVEAAVVGYPHPIKGQSIYAYLTLSSGVEGSDELRCKIKDWVKEDLSPIATPELIHFTPALPKTRSGKIMRRILRKIASNDFDNLGDTTTLADPTVVEDLIANRLNRK